MKFYHLPVCLCLALFLGSCAPETLEQSEELRNLSTRYGLPLAKLSFDKGPLWFEFTPEGPSQIASPIKAALTPFEAWPNALRLADFVDIDEFPCGIVNGWGFLSIINDSNGDIYLMGRNKGQLMGHYSVANSFKIDNTPALVLYRDFFYRDSEQRIPIHRFIALDSKEQDAEPAFFTAYPGKDAWEFNSIVHSPKGPWLARVTKQETGELAYIKTDNLAEPGEPSSQAAWLGAQEPQTIVEAQGPFKELLIQAGKILNPQQLFVIKRYRADRGSFFNWVISAIPSTYDRRLLNFGDIQLKDATAWTNSASSILLEEDGAFWYVLSSESETIGSGHLPLLPENYVYTDAALLALPESPATGAQGGEKLLLIASWEERNSWQVGSAGLYIHRLK